MNKEDIIKPIDGVVYYHYDYADFLYAKLQEKDDEIKILEKKLKDNIRFDECRFKELFEKEKQIDQLTNIIKEIEKRLYKKPLDDYDSYTANVVCDIQSDFEEILRENNYVWSDEE